MNSLTSSTSSLFFFADTVAFISARGAGASQFISLVGIPPVGKSHLRSYSTFLRPSVRIIVSEIISFSKFDRSLDWILKLDIPGFSFFS